MLSPVRFDVHGFTAESQQDEQGIQEAAQIRQFFNFFSHTNF